MLNTTIKHTITHNKCSDTGEYTNKKTQIKKVRIIAAINGFKSHPSVILYLIRMINIDTFFTIL